MKHTLIPVLGLAAVTVLFVAGCSQGTNAPDGHAAHNTQGGAVDHTAMHHGDMAAAATAPADGVKPYPLTTCVVSGEKLGEMGKPQQLVYQGQEMKFCCKDCVKDFQADPDKYLKKLAAAGSQPMDMSTAGGDHSQHQHAH